MYTNRSGREGAKSKGSVHVNGAGDTTGMAKSECREQDDAGVVMLVSGDVAGLVERVEERVSLLLLLEIGLECTTSDPVAREIGGNGKHAAFNIELLAVVSRAARFFARIVGWKLWATQEACYGWQRRCCTAMPMAGYQRWRLPQSRPRTCASSLLDQKDPEWAGLHEPFPCQQTRRCRVGLCNHHCLAGGGSISISCILDRSMAMLPLIPTSLCRTHQP